MRKNLIILIIILITLFSSSQAFAEVVRKMISHNQYKGFDYVFYDNNKEVARQLYNASSQPVKLIGNIPDGIVKEYNERGQLDAEITYKNNQKNGITKQYFTDGKIWTEMNFINNKANGIVKSYYESGELYTITNYIDGQQEGIGKAYYRNGKIYYESLFTNGKEDGIQKVYYDSGILMSEIGYKKGIRQNSKAYDKSGNLESEWVCNSDGAVMYADFYQNGKKIKRKKYGDYGYIEEENY